MGPTQPGLRSLLTQPPSCLASQEQVTAAVAHAVEQQMQKLLEETQLDMNEFDNLLQPIIDTCTKDAISVSAGGGVGWVLPESGAPDEMGAFCGLRRVAVLWGEPHLPLVSALEPCGQVCCFRGEGATRQAEAWVCSGMLGRHALRARPRPPGRLQGWWPGGELIPAHHRPGCCRPGRTGCLATPSPLLTAS